MKKALSLITLTVLAVALLGSCSKINERLDNLEKKVDGIENEQIASINSQISGITSSISDLGQIRSDISSLKQSASDHSVDIFNLEEADRALADRILNLEDYLDDVLPNYAEKEWVEATFSTLEQYEATCDTIAKIDARIGALDAKLSKDIKATADSLTKWVNKKFEGYYTAAEMDAKLAQMKSAVDSAKASGKITDAKADSIASELTNAKAAVDTAKANIRKEYRSAIDTAIKASEGKLTKALTDAISEVNGKIESLVTRVDNLAAAVADLTGRVKALEEMIQSVVIVPAYSDGSVKTLDDTLFIDLAVTPKDAVSRLKKTDVKILLHEVQTKAVALVTVPTDSIKVFTPDKENGIVSIKANIAYFIKEAKVFTVAVNVDVGNGISDITTEFVPVKIESSCIAAGTMITMENGGQKAVEEIEVGDVIRTVNHETGEVSSAPVCFVWETKNVSNAFTLTFEDGVEVTVIEEHGFYDQEERQYAFINANNAKDYIGHHFFDADNNRWLELKSFKPSNGSVDAYAIVTSKHLNHLSNGILSMSDGSYKVLANIFEYDEQMRFDADKKAADIAAYGLTPLEKILEYKGFLEADYYDYNLQYLNVAIGKGLTSWDYVKALSDYCEANNIY